MYNNGNSSKNVTGTSVVDGTLENADFADNGLSGDKIDGGIISNFQSTGIDDNATSTKLTVADTGIDVTGSVTCDGLNVEGAKGTISGAGSFEALELITSDANRIYITGNSSSTGDMWRLGTSTSNQNLNIDALQPTGRILFRTGGTNERMRIDSDGIKFNGDTAAANALDDYEEGTWTPTIIAATTDFSSVSYHSGVTGGKYTKIGSRVFLTGTIYTTAVTTGSAAGNIGISNLPFVPENNTLGQNGNESGSVSEADGWAGDHPDGLRAESHTTYLRLLYRTAANGASSSIQAADVHTGSGKNLLRFTISYKTD
jgi:hypothetical protein